MLSTQEKIGVLDEIRNLGFSESLDCSEYANMLHDKYDFDVFTVFFIDSMKYLGEFKWYFGGAGYSTIETYRYHTFCITKVGVIAYVVDMTVSERVIPLDDFIKRIIQLNKDMMGFKFVIMQGDGSSLSLDLRLKISCQSLRSFSYKHSKERILGYTVIPDMNKYLVIYAISGTDRLITFSLVDPQQDYDRAGVLKAHIYDDYFIGIGREFFLKDFYTLNNRLDVSWVDENLNKLLRDLLY